MKNKTICHLFISFAMILCVSGCAQMLNEKNPSASSVLQDACGIVYVPKTSDEETSEFSESKNENELPVNSIYSYCIYDYDIIYVNSYSDAVYTFPVENGFYYYMHFQDAENTWLSSYNYEAVDAKFSVYDSTGSFYGEGDESSLYYFTPTDFGTYTIRFSSSTSYKNGCCAIQFYRRKKTSTYSSVKVYSTYNVSDSSGFYMLGVGPNTSFRYSFYVTAGKTYYITLVDKNSAFKDAVLGSDTYTTYGMYAIYKSDGSFVLASDCNDVDYSFYAESSGTYVIDIQSWGQTAMDTTTKNIGSYDSGTVAFRIWSPN